MLCSVPGSVVHRCVKQCKRECFNVDLECIYTPRRAKKWSSYWDAELRWSEIKRVPSIQSSSAVAVITFKIFTGKKTSSIHHRLSYRQKCPEVVLQYADELFTYNLTSLIPDWYYKACWRHTAVIIFYMEACLQQTRVSLKRGKYSQWFKTSYFTIMFFVLSLKSFMDLISIKPPTLNISSHSTSSSPRLCSVYHMDSHH